MGIKTVMRLENLIVIIFLLALLGLVAIPFIYLPLTTCALSILVISSWIILRKELIKKYLGKKEDNYPDFF